LAGQKIEASTNAVVEVPCIKVLVVFFNCGNPKTLRLLNIAAKERTLFLVKPSKILKTIERL
jgi:hypothetical protein